MTVLYLYILMFGLLNFYIVQALANHKKLKSISITDKYLKKPWKWTFNALMMVSGWVISYSGFVLFEENCYRLIIAGMLIGNVGIFADYTKNKFYLYAHIISATAGITLFVLSILKFDSWYLIGVPIIVALLTWKYSRKKYVFTFNLEYNVIVSTFLVLIWQITRLISM